ncbi:phenylalanine--tRNA ligase subunit beta [Pseudonocardiaceae bacterium YIM PH 21723]|nr:phenylalanine--tRNA ligase subunit beta [Pseudonocardiaceae bacterium YIM PH 21723]
MRIPVSWLAQHLELPEDTTPDAIAEAFVRIGHEVEDVIRLDNVSGPLVVGRVESIEELAEFKKPIRYCVVEVGDENGNTEDGKPTGRRNIICGARNFAEGDLIVAALPGAVLPGDFAIGERKTYGRMSQGMICSISELGLGEDHAGIMVLPPGSAEPGDDAKPLLGLDDVVIDLSITPDKGFAMSARGLARELAAALDLDYHDPAVVELPETEGESWPVTIEDEVGCPRFVTRRVTGVDPAAPSPLWLRRFLTLSGMRSISLAVDVTNYVMLLLGQPLHAFDATKLKGGIIVRRATEGEKLKTLDGVERTLTAEDMLVCDESGPLSIAGVMGGEHSEIDSETTDVLIEGATWDPPSISRTARRHKLPSEAAKRYERATDPAINAVAVELAAQLLVEHGDGTIARGRTDVGSPVLSTPVTMPLSLPDRVAGVNYGRGVTARRLQQIGCQIEVGTDEQGVGVVVATPPTWRSDLTQPADLVEEVLRLEGYHTIPSELPAAPGGAGLTAAQRRKRRVASALAVSGYTEVVPFPFTGAKTLDAMNLAADDPRRNAVALLNPLEADKNLLITTLLPSLFETLSRNISRGQRDLALFHIGQVTLPRTDAPKAPQLGTDRRPTDEELAQLTGSVPAQPVHVGAILAGKREPAGWWGPGREATWADAVEAARTVAAASGVELEIVAADLAPWHPGRCAQLRVGGFPVGHAGELHPKVLEALGLPKRTCAMELDLDLLPLDERRPAPIVSPYPPALQDIALVVDQTVPVAQLIDTVQQGGGELLESTQLFDVYAGDQVAEGKKSVAVKLVFRAQDRTLTAEEASAARDAAIAAAGERHGATLRA